MHESAEPPSGEPLSERELAAWRGMLRVHAQVTRALDAQMRADHGLSVSSYEVLLFLGQAEGNRMRMADIASRTLLTRSGLTRLVDRLVQLGYVCRSASEGDGRGLYAELTASGEATLEVAQRSHRQGVRETFLDRMSDADQAALGKVWQRLLADSVSG